MSGWNKENDRNIQTVVVPAEIQTWLLPYTCLKISSSIQLFGHEGRIYTHSTYNRASGCILSFGIFILLTSIKPQLYMFESSLTQSIRALLEKLPTVQPLKNFPAFYGTRRFITGYTRALHWFLS
jgi:hypothetical protein